MRQYVVVMYAREFNSFDLIIIGDILCTGMPKHTHEYQCCARLAAIFGFGVAVLTWENYQQHAARERRWPEGSPEGSITYKQAHEKIWTQLRKRGEVLARRRKDKK